MKIRFPDNWFYSAPTAIPSAVVLFLLAALPACNKEEASSDSSPAQEGPAPDVVAPPLPIVATYGDGETIVQADIDQAILSAPPQLRSPGQTPFPNWYAGWVDEIFLQSVFEPEAAKSDVDQSPDFIRQTRSMRRNIYSEYKLRNALSTEAPVTEEDLRKHFEDTKEEWHTPEARNVYHIFLRFGEDDESSKEAILERLHELKKRVSNGENFGRLASQFSESETRHQEGWLGFVSEGQYPDAADKVIFSIDEGEVSDPVVVGDGAHIFYNENTVAAKSPTFEEVKVLISQKIEFERLKKILARLADQSEIRGSSFFPNEEELKKLMGSENPDTVILALGTFELTVKDFREIIRGYRRQVATRTDILGEDAPLLLYEEVKNREIIFQEMLADTETDYSAVEAVYLEKKDAIRMEQFLRKRMITWAENRPELLQEFFNNNIKRFQTTGQVHLKGIQLPIPNNASAVMARLEEAKTELETGKADWDTIAKSVGTQAEDWGWFPTSKLSRFDGKAARIAFGMDAGEVAPPYTYGDSIRMFEVLAHEVPDPPYFDRIRHHVTSVYVETNAKSIRGQLVKEVKEEQNLQVFRDNFPSPTEILHSPAPSGSP